MAQLDQKLAIVNECIDAFCHLNNAYYLVLSIKNVLEMRDFDDTEWADHVASLLYRYIDETESLMPTLAKALNKLSPTTELVNSEPKLQRIK